MFMLSEWRKLSLSTRALLAKEFGFSKTGPTHVVDNRIESDGYKFEDIERALTVDAMQKYIGFPVNDTEMLWCYMVDKVEGRTPVDPSSVTNTGYAVIVEAVQTSPTVIDKEPHEMEDLTPKKFCQFCTSKGVRHLKICTRPV